MTVAEWSPLVDTIEDEKECVIKADLPEVKKEDIKFVSIRPVPMPEGRNVHAEIIAERRRP